MAKAEFLVDFYDEVEEDLNVKEELKEECVDTDVINVSDNQEAGGRQSEVDEEIIIKLEWCEPNIDENPILEYVLAELENEKKRFECDKCDYRCKRNSTLKGHMASKHTKKTEVKWFKCEKCAFKCMRNDILKVHIFNKHERKRLPCEKCDYKCTSKDALRNHMIRRHLNDDEINWFRCKDCEYKCKFRWELKEHVIKKHLDNKDEMKWVSCETCDYRCKGRRYLALHMISKHLKAAEMNWLINATNANRSAKS